MEDERPMTATDSNSTSDRSASEPTPGVNPYSTGGGGVSRSWASTLDRDRYRAYAENGQIVIQSIPPEDVQVYLQPRTADLERSHEAMGLMTRYFVDGRARPDQTQPPTADEVTNDLATVIRLIDEPPTSPPVDLADLAGLVAGAVLRQRFVNGSVVATASLEDAAALILDIAENLPPRPFEYEATYFEQGADRSAARALPLLLLPAAEELRLACGTEATTGLERIRAAGARFARAVASETRLHLARGLDAVWGEPCSPGSCHHEWAFGLVVESVRDCVIGPWDQEGQQRTLGRLADPVATSLNNLDADDIYVGKLDAAIRACGVATSTDSCIRIRAGELLSALLGAQRRTLLKEPSYDDRGSHTLVAARALLQLAGVGDDQPWRSHTIAYAADAQLLHWLLAAFAAAAQETEALASIARRIWPDIMTVVLDQLAEPEHRLGHGTYRQWAVAALLPNPPDDAMFMYREIVAAPGIWTDPLSWRRQIEAWLTVAAGMPECVDALIALLKPLKVDDQVRYGLRWIRALIPTGAPENVASRRSLSSWLIDIRSVTSDVDAEVEWQTLVDMLVVAGNVALAPYSE